MILRFVRFSILLVFILSIVACAGSGDKSSAPTNPTSTSNQDDTSSNNESATDGDDGTTDTSTDTGSTDSETSTDTDDSASSDGTTSDGTATDGDDGTTDTSTDTGSTDSETSTNTDDGTSSGDSTTIDLPTISSNELQQLIENSVTQAVTVGTCSYSYSGSTTYSVCKDENENVLYSNEYVIDSDNHITYNKHYDETGSLTSWIEYTYNEVGDYLKYVLKNPDGTIKQYMDYIYTSDHNLSETKTTFVETGYISSTFYRHEQYGDKKIKIAMNSDEAPSSATKMILDNSFYSNRDGEITSELIYQGQYPIQSGSMDNPTYFYYVDQIAKYIVTLNEDNNITRLVQYTYDADSKIQSVITTTFEEQDTTDFSTVESDLVLNATSSVQSIAADNYKIYRMVIPSSGRLTVETVSDFDTYGVLYNSSFDEVKSDQDSGTCKNFKMSYVQLDAGTYYLKVFGNEHSSIDSFQINNSFTLDQIEVSAQKALNTNQIEVQWSSVGGATSYTLYRNTSQYGTYTTIASGITATNYVDTTIANDTDYYYKVEAFKDGASYNSSSKTDCGYSQTVAPSVTTLTASDKTYDGVQISMTQYCNATYELYFSDAENGTYQTIDDNLSTYYFNHKAPDYNKTYYYKARIRREGQTSDFSLVETGSANFKPDASYKTSSTGIDITWSSIPDAISYNLYHSTSSSTGYSLMVSSLTGNEYNDTSVTDTNYHYYKVEAIFADAANNFMSLYDYGLKAESLHAQIDKTQNLDTPGYAKKILVNGDETLAIVADMFGGVAFVDISDLTSPRRISSYDINTTVYDIALSTDENKLYLARGPDGLEVFDISDVTQPSSISVYDNADFISSVTLSQDDSKAYVGMGEYGVGILDISDSSNIAQMGSYHTTCMEFIQNIEVSDDGKTIFVADEDNGVHILNVANPASITSISTYANSGTYSIKKSGNYLFIASKYYGVKIVDISDTSIPTLIDDIDTDGTALQISVPSLGSYMIVADGSGGMLKVDISDLSNMSVINQYQSRDKINYVLELSDGTVLNAEGYYGVNFF